MTREETIEWLGRIKDRYIHGGDEGFDNKRKEAIDMAIEALSERSAPRVFYAVPTSEIKTLRPKGKWIEWKKKGEFSDGRYQCSQCKHNYSFEYNFCPTCGADMRGDTE